MSDTPKEYLFILNDLKASYPKEYREDPDKVASRAAEIVRRGWAGIGANGFVSYKPQVAMLAPKLLPAPQMSENMDDRQKAAVFVALMARNSDRLPAVTAPAADPVDAEYVPNATSDKDRIHNARLAASRAKANLAAASAERAAANEAKAAERQAKYDAAVAHAAAELHADDGETRTHAQEVIRQDGIQKKINIAEIRAKLGPLPGSDVGGGQE